MRWANFGTLSMRSTMYEVLDIPKMIDIKAKHVRGIERLPKAPGDKKTSRWGGMMIIRSGTGRDKLNFLPEGCELKMCLQDTSVWEVFIPAEYKKSKKLLAKRLDAIAFM